MDMYTKFWMQDGNHIVCALVRWWVNVRPFFQALLCSTSKPSGDIPSLSFGYIVYELIKKLRPSKARWWWNDWRIFSVLGKRAVGTNVHTEERKLEPSRQSGGASIDSIHDPPQVLMLPYIVANRLLIKVIAREAHRNGFVVVHAIADRTWWTFSSLSAFNIADIEIVMEHAAHKLTTCLSDLRKLFSSVKRLENALIYSKPLYIYRWLNNEEYPKHI